MQKKTTYLIVNFGGPRDLNEVEEFLIALLTDQDVIRTPFPAFVHRFLFTRVAKKRSKKIAPDYALIGGGSPIYADTEALAEQVGVQLGANTLTFHRYLPKTHPGFIATCKALATDEVLIFPLFPQFSYATTGSIARWFAKHLPKKVVQKMRWVKSYPEHPAYIAAFRACIRNFLNAHQLKEEETALLFSAHGLPQQFITTGDVYAEECERSFKQIATAFPEASSHLSYQSQFGKEEWIRPYTNEFCQEVTQWASGRKHVVFVPLSFTSDHIETLYEVEQLYLPVVREKGFQAWRCPALNLRADWISAVAQIVKEEEKVENRMLVRSA